MKSGGSGSKDEAANLHNIVIAGCVVYHAHGGFVIGSNTDGGMENIFVSDCNFIGTDIGIRVKSNAGRGGIVKNIFIKNIFMHDIVNEAISFDTYYEDKPAGETETNDAKLLTNNLPDFSDFYFDSIYCNGANIAVAITGLPGMPIRKIHFSNIVISSCEGFKAADAADIDLQNVNIITAQEPIYDLHSVTNINIQRGFFPKNRKRFLKADDHTKGVKVTQTDLNNSKDAIELQQAN
jgi:DNA sulfur modification protein DndE